jgi:hypothetical protein
MDFSQSQQTALLLAGTVALPCPYPSVGSLSVLVVPEAGDFEVYIKIVQVVSLRRIITRFVRLADVRAVHVLSPDDPSGGPETWPLIGSAAVRRQLETIEKDLIEKARKSNDARAFDWLASAIVYVPESAPILHRDEIGVTAAVSAEDVAFNAWKPTCPHPNLELPPVEAKFGLCPRS